jgi:hypothetical protein
MTLLFRIVLSPPGLLLSALAGSSGPTSPV